MVNDPMLVSYETSPREVLAKMKKEKSDLAVVVDGSRRFVAMISADEIQMQRGKTESLEKS